MTAKVTKIGDWKEAARLLKELGPPADVRTLTIGDYLVDGWFWPAVKRAVLMSLVFTVLYIVIVWVTAAIADLAAVVFARGKAVPADVVDLARQMKVPVFASDESLFEAAGRLYALFGPGPAEPGARRQA